MGKISISEEVIRDMIIEKFMSDQTILATAKDMIERKLRDLEMVPVSVAAKTLGYQSIKTFRRNHRDIIHELAPKCQRVAIQDIANLRHSKTHD